MKLPKLISMVVALTTTIAGAESMRVMTRNIYLGAPIGPVLAAQAMQEVPPLISAMWSAIQATDFRQRAQLLADEIVTADPHIIGLQEVALYRVQSPGDFLQGNPQAATEVAIDFLDVLLRELEARGASYREVSTVTGADVEMPSATGDDIRLTDRDVVLARSDVSTGESQFGNYDNNLTVALGGSDGPPVTLLRGWSAADATIGGQTVRFITTHLETSVAEPVQMAQAAQLLETIVASPLPVVVLGDFNSAADGSTTETYGMLMQAGLRDAWVEANTINGSGLTCCHDDDLLNDSESFNRRIDYILIGGPDSASIVAESADIVGASADSRTHAGLWPSDHGGIVSTLRVDGGATAVNSVSWGMVKSTLD